MTRHSKEIYLNVNKLNLLPTAEQEELEPQNRLLLQTDDEHVNIELGDLREFVSGDFSDRAEVLEDEVDELDDRVTAIEAGGGGTGGTGNDKNFTYEQVSPSAVWLITHPLVKYPSVTTIDSSGALCQGGVTYIDINTVQVEFAGAMAGQAFLN